MGLSEHGASWVLNWVGAESTNAHQVHPQGRAVSCGRQGLKSAETLRADCNEQVKKDFMAQD